MKGNFEKSLARVLVYEGGNDDDPRDPGGRTSRGIIQREYDVYRRRKGLPTRDVWKADQSEIVEIYRINYWDKSHCDELPEGLDFVVFDGSVNSGVAQSAKWLQRALGITADGSIGNTTILAANDDQDNDLLIAGICSRRLSMLQGLKTWVHFGNGWSARVANVKKIGQAWASGSVGPNPVKVAADGGNRKARVSDVALPPVGNLPPVVTTTVGTLGSAASDAAKTLEPMRDIAPILTWAFVGLTLVGIAATIGVQVLRARAQAAQDGTGTAEVDDAADEGLEPVPV